MTDQAAPKKPRKRKEKGPFSDELLDALLSHLKGHDAESLLGQSGLVGQLKKQLMERMLAGELRSVHTPRHRTVIARASHTKN